MGDAIKFIKRYNVALTEHNLTLPNSCKHYLHFNVKLPYFEKEQSKRKQKNYINQKQATKDKALM